MTNINCNYADDSQIIMSGYSQLRIFSELFWPSYTKEKLVSSFWPYLENVLNVKIDATGWPQLVVIQCKSKEEALKFKLKYL
jgi:hypothetical protein